MCACECVRTGERAQRVRGRAPRSPARRIPASCSPRCDASRIPKARSHPPVRSHSRTHAHTWTRTHPRCRTPGSALQVLALPGRSSRSPAAPASSPRDPSWANRASRSLATPRGHPAGVPAPPLCPARSWPRSQPQPGPLPGSCGFPLTPARGCVFSLLGPPTRPRAVPGLSTVSPSASPPPFSSPTSPRPCAVSHILRITAGTACR